MKESFFMNLIKKKSKNKNIDKTPTEEIQNIQKSTKINKKQAEKNKNISASSLLLGNVKLGEKRASNKEDYRISILPNDEEITQNQRKVDKKKLKKSTKNFIGNKKSKKSKDSDGIQRNYVFIRREVQDYTPLYKLDFFNKLIIVNKYLDEKSGRSKKREAEKFQKEQQKRIKAQSMLKRELTENLKDLVDRKVDMKRIEVNLPKGLDNILNEVLSQDAFSIYKIKRIEENPNLKLLDIKVPPVLEFRLDNSNFII